jgi:integrase/recombinase XerD
MARQNDPQTRCTPVHEWPTLDREAWLAAQQPADPFDPALGYALRWKATTRKEIQGGYGRWLGCLERAGQLDPSAPPGERATRGRVKGYLEALRASGLADNSLAGRLQQLANALRAIAPDHDWSWIHRASSRIYANARPVRNIAERMQPIQDIIALGFDLMHAAEHDRFRTPCERATLYRDGLIVALIAPRPFRLENFASIALGKHLEERGGAWKLFFDGTETKEGRPIECGWPHNLTDQLRRYLDVHREQLLKSAPAPRRPTQALWISRRGLPMGHDAISVQIGERTKEAFGKPINPHTFRHIAATAVATSNPEGAFDIESILGHSSMTASEKHYNRANMLGAAATLQARVADLRKERRPRSSFAVDGRAEQAVVVNSRGFRDHLGEIPGDR